MNGRLEFLRLWDHHGGCVDVGLDEEPRVDAAVQLWIDSGRQRDTVLSLVTVEGTTFRILASTIVAWMESTPESRTEATRIELMLDDEVDGERKAAGKWID